MKTELRGLGVEFRKAEKLVAKARTGRDKAIKQAVRDGHPRKDVAAWAGVSRSYIDRLVRG